MHYSFIDLEDCSVHEPRGLIGRLEDLLFEEETWAVRLLGVKPLLSARRSVYISSGEVLKIFPSARLLHVADSSSKQQSEPALISSAFLLGVSIDTADACFGAVSDLLISRGDWRIRYVVADLHAWLPGKTIILPTELTQLAHDSGGIHGVRVPLSRHELKAAPRFDRFSRESGRESPLSRSEEAKVWEFYRGRVLKRSA